MQRSHVVEVKDLWFAYSKENWVLQEVSMRAYEGEQLVLLGPNGCGKTTLLLAILGFLNPNRGKVSLFQANPEKLARDLRIRIAAALDGILNPYLTVKENIVFQLVMKGVTPREADKTAEAYISEFELSRLSSRLFYKCSTGEQKLTLVLSSLMPHPLLLILDEPFQGVDPGRRLVLSKRLNELAGEQNTTTILTLHELDALMSLKRARVLVMLKGRIIGEIKRPSDLERSVLIGLSTDRYIGFKQTLGDMVEVLLDVGLGSNRLLVVKPHDENKTGPIMEAARHKGFYAKLLSKGEDFGEAYIYMERSQGSSKENVSLVSSNE